MNNNQNKIELSIIIPCYNEEENIPHVLRRFDSILKARPNINAELIIVDNGSLDRTGEVITDEISKNAYIFARKVKVEVNKGYGFGILSGLKAAKGPVLAFTHGDLQTDPEDVFKAYELYLTRSRTENKVLIKGRRHSRKLSECFFSLGMQLLASAILRIYLSEINAQPKVFPREFLRLLTSSPEDFSFDLYLLAVAKKTGYKIYEIPVYPKNRMLGEAKGGSGSDFSTKKLIIKNTLKYLFTLKNMLSTEIMFGNTNFED